ncbi:MAG: hypothetical protein ABIB97_05890 [Patescibacteria group bacterium]
MEALEIQALIKPHLPEGITCWVEARRDGFVAILNRNETFTVGSMEMLAQHYPPNSIIQAVSTGPRTVEIMAGSGETLVETFESASSTNW